MSDCASLTKQQLVDWLMSAKVQVPYEATANQLRQVVITHANYLRNQGYVVDFNRLPSSYEKNIGDTVSAAVAAGDKIPCSVASTSTAALAKNDVPSGSIPTIPIPTTTIPNPISSGAIPRVTSAPVEMGAASTSWAAITDAAMTTA